MTPEALQRLEAALARSDEEATRLVCPDNYPLVTRADLRALLEERRWISVQEKLPEEHESVLIAAKWDGSVWVGKSQRGHGGWRGVIASRVTHWMPLPAPPGFAHQFSRKPSFLGQPPILPKNSSHNHQQTRSQTWKS